MSVSGVCGDCCGLCDVSKCGWLNLLSFLCLASHCDGGRSVWNVMVNCYRYHQLAATSPWYPCTLADYFCPLWLRNIESASSQCFWVTVGKRWPLFNTCHQLVAASPWHPCYMGFGWRLSLKNYWCKGLLLSTVAQKYWVLKLTMFLSDSRQEVAFVYDVGVCVFQLAHGRLQRKNLNIPKVLEKLNGVLGLSLAASYWLHIKGFGNW